MKNLKDLTDSDLDDLKDLVQNEADKLNDKNDEKRLADLKKEFIEGKDLTDIYKLKSEIIDEKHIRYPEKKSKIFGDPLVEFD